MKEEYKRYWSVRKKSLTVERICKMCESDYTEIDCPKCPVFIWTNNLKRWEKESILRQSCRRLNTEHSNVPQPVKEYIDLQVRNISINFRNEIDELEDKLIPNVS